MTKKEKKYGHGRSLSYYKDVHDLVWCVDGGGDDSGSLGVIFIRIIATRRQVISAHYHQVEWKEGKLMAGGFTNNGLIQHGFVAKCIKMNTPNVGELLVPSLWWSSSV